MLLLRILLCVARQHCDSPVIARRQPAKTLRSDFWIRKERSFLGLNSSCRLIRQEKMCELILTWIEFVIPTNPPKSGNDITGKVESLAGDFCCDSVNFETA